MLVIRLSEGVLQSQDRRGRSAVPAWFAGGIRLHKLHEKNKTAVYGFSNDDRV